MSLFRLSPRTFRLEDANVLVTGASSGIGAQLALDLAARGCHLALVARRAERLEDVARRCRAHGVRAAVVPADLADRDAARSVAATAEAEIGPLDVVVNNAGRPTRVDVRRLDADVVAETMAVNFLGAVTVTLAALPSMLERDRGCIVNVGSLAGRVPAPREAAYVASKFALAGWSDTLAVDLAGTGIAVHHVAPGVIDTPLWDVPGQEPSPYRGRRTPATAVSGAIVRLIETGRYEAVVPRSFAPVIRIRGLLGEAFLALTARFDRRGNGRDGDAG